MREPRLNIRRVVVLGAGTMGAQVAAHLVAQGLEVTLLDVVPNGATDRNALAKKAVETLKKLKPSPLHLAEHLTALKLGNFEDDWKALASADWVFEAVIEDLEIKKQLFTKVAAAINKTAVVTTNSSGLGVGAMSAHLAPDVRKRFFGAHFFNPPRYLKLLEVIPGPETDPAVLAGFSEFGDRVLGKGVVPCKDTPNFIGNRIGSYGLSVVLQTMRDLDMTIEEVDALTGAAIGRARSATFRTCDIAGVDVCVKVIENLYPAVPNDPEREVFRVPDFMKEMVKRGWLGRRPGAGFYKKEGKEIRTLDWKTLEYRERKKAKFASVDAAQSVADIGARLRQILGNKDKASDFCGGSDGDVVLRGLAGAGDLRRRAGGRPGHGVGLRLGDGPLPHHGRGGGGGAGRAGQGRAACRCPG
jgi:3-hydroxyacyl-CoA dehydrogenase